MRYKPLDSPDPTYGQDCSMIRPRSTADCEGSALPRLVRLVTIALCVLASPVHANAAGLAELDLQVLDAETKKPLAVRLSIMNSLGRAPRIRGVPRLGNDFTFRDTLTFEMKRGRYRFTIDRGPHYQQRTGHLDADSDGFDQKVLLLPRFANPRAEHWYGGDLLVPRKREDLELLLDAEELDMVCVPGWKAGEAFGQLEAKASHGQEQLGQAIADFSAGLCRTRGGRLLGCNLPAGLRPEKFSQDLLGFARDVHATGGVVALLDAYAWDLPMLLAHNQVDAIALWNEHQERDEDQHAFQGRPFGEPRFKAPHGLARYNEQIYFHILRCGLRVAPAALSGSGSTKSPPGFNRVYVHSGAFNAATWFAGLRAGRSVLSNGPILRVRANGELPGHVFEVAEGPLELEVTCSLSTRQKIDYLEIVKDGLVQEAVRLDEWAKRGGRLPKVAFDRSGWLLVRAAASGGPTYRAAMSAPFYVQVGAESRISEKSAQFFVDWVYERARQLRKSGLAPGELTRLMKQQLVARDFFQDLKSRANAK